MKRFVTFCLTMMLGQAAGSALAADKAFESNYARARKNVAARAGATYDYKLGTAMQASADFQQRFKDCIKRYPGKQEVHGYFSFSSATRYTVVLEPRSAYSGCLTHAMEGHRVPPPPGVPYLNPFELSASPAGK